MSSATRFDSLRNVRRGARRRNRWRVAAISVAVVVLLLGLGYLVGFSPVFAVRQTVVEGASRVAPAEIAAASAIDEGIPLIQVSELQIAQRVVSLPEIRKVTVSRELPGTVRIVVEERTPVLVVESGGDWQLVDADGARFRPRKEQPDELPRAEVAGQDPALLADAAAVAGALPRELAERAKVLSASSRDDLTLTMDNGREIFFGSRDQAALKGQVAVTLLDQPKGIIDVSSPGNPVIR